MNGAARPPAGNVYLVGMMGCGKSTVGRRLAVLMRRQFIDTDRAIEQKSGATIGHIFELEGEAGFRRREAKLLEEVSARRGAVVATGGGLILRERNRVVLRATGTVIYLRAAPELLRERLKNSRARPLLNTPEPQTKLAELLAARAPMYRAAADIIVDVTADTSARIAEQIHRLLLDACKR